MEAARIPRMNRRGRVVNRVSQSKHSSSKSIQFIEALKSQPEALTGKITNIRIFHLEVLN